MKLTLIAILVLSPISFCLAQNADFRQSPVDFFKEQITLTVDDSTSQVAGIYYFRNKLDNSGKFPVAFPFYVDSLSLFPDSMAAYTIDNLDTIPINIRGNFRNGSAFLNIPLKSHGITIWHLDYRQRILSSRAVYIITSTASWGKPLEDATYRFIAPSDFQNVETWPAPDSVVKQKDFDEYTTHKTNFMPRQDMEIRWDSR